MKKRLSLLLSVIMLLGIMAPAALAAEFRVTTVVQPQYEDAENFSDGYAAVKKGGKWGYIDEDGKMVISPKYDWAGQFNEGVAVVATLTHESSSLDGEWVRDVYTLYLLTENGAETPLTYTFYDEEVENAFYIYESSDTSIEEAGASWFCQNGVVNANGTPYTADGREIRPSSPLRDTDGEEFGIFEMTGPCVGGVIPMRTYWEGYLESNVLCFYMDVSGNVIRTFPIAEIENGNGQKGITCVYAPDQDRITAVYAGFDSDWEWQYGWGVMDLNGSWVAQPVYSGCRYWMSGRFYADGRMIVQNSAGRYGAIDKNGITVLPMEYEFLSSFQEGVCAAKKDGKWFYIDLNGKTYQPGSLDGGAASANALSFFSNGVAPVYVAANGQAYCIQNVPKNGVLPAVAGTENLGREVYFPDYEEGSSDLGLLTSLGDIIAIKENGKWGYAQLEFTLDLPDQSAMDAWAYDEVVKAIEAGLVPNELQNQYKSNITRADFALLLTEVATVITDKDLETLVKDTTGRELDDIVRSYPFNDTASREVIAANALGIINGYGGGKFGPYDSITRQDAATMLLRAAVAIKADALDGWGDKIAQAGIEFDDGAAFSDYAKEAIQTMAAISVMNGTGQNKFSPKATYTRQQSFITAYRLMVQILDQ